ncbi:hypothetical protein FA13DRAFT_1704710 [Coprinellus micaceus]|uniref:Uncharacterized protein n=1 Tax=Coprinellus micaceus TaxID=71717 RepID=A0A4Y7TYQ0_COPMI|nr:hypothetical protein FA13DRAFT_1704710 [Coprinellus micaceus]
MASPQAYIPPVNPDSRPLPVGWTQHYDSQIYLDMNVLPPTASLIHPASSMNNSFRPNVPSPSSSSASPDPPGWEQSPATLYTSAIQAPRERQEKTLAQQLYSSALSHKPKERNPSGGSAQTPSPDYFTEDAAPAYSSTDPSTSGCAPIAGSPPATGANRSIASGSTPSDASHPFTSSTSSSLRRPLPPPPSARSMPSAPPQASLSPPVPPPPFPEAIKGLVQPTPLKAPSGHFHDGDRGNLADALLQAIPELDTPLPSPSTIRDRRVPPSTMWAPAEEPAAQRVSEPQDDSNLIPPDFAATVSPDPSPVYVSGIPEGSVPVPRSRASTLDLPPLPLSPTFTDDDSANVPLGPTHSSTPSPQEVTTVPAVPEAKDALPELPKKPPRNAFVPSQIMAIANRNMQAAIQDPDVTSGSKILNHSSSLPSVPSPAPVERGPTRDMEFSAGDGLADPFDWPSSATSPSPMDSQSSLSHYINPTASSSRNLPRGVGNRDSGYVEVPSSSSFSAFSFASGAEIKKESRVGSKGFAALKRPSAMASSASLDAHGDGRAETSDPPPHRLTFSTENLPSLIKEVKIASPTLSAIPLPSDESGPNPPTQKPPSRPRSLYGQPSSALDHHRISYSHERSRPAPTHSPQDLQSFLDITPREPHAGRKLTNLGQGPRNVSTLDRTNTGLSAGSSESRSVHSNESSHSSKGSALRAMVSHSSASSIPLPQPPMIYGDTVPSQRGRNAANILASLVHEPQSSDSDGASWGANATASSPAGVGASVGVEFEPLDVERIVNLERCQPSYDDVRSVPTGSKWFGEAVAEAWWFQIVALLVSAPFAFSRPTLRRSIPTEYWCI